MIMLNSGCFYCTIRNGRLVLTGRFKGGEGDEANRVEN